MARPGPTKRLFHTLAVAPPVWTKVPEPWSFTKVLLTTNRLWSGLAPSVP